MGGLDTLPGRLLFTFWLGDEKTNPPLRSPDVRVVLSF